MKISLYHRRLATCILGIMLATLLLKLQAQDYFISFTGSGASTTVDSVKIENLTQGTKQKMKGSDVLHLMGTTGIETIMGDETGKITFYPNPMKDFTRMQFVLPVSGETLITLYDVSGRTVSQARDFLSTGKHTYGILSIKKGIYFIRVNSGKYSCGGSIISSGSQNAGAKIIYENTMAIQEKQIDSKGTGEEKVMQYTTGDRLKLNGISGIYSTIVTDVPVADKTITFNFIPCTDGNGNNYPIVQINTTKGIADNLDPEEEKGIQTWMAENLKAMKYNDGTDIPNITDNTTWQALTTGAYSDYSNTPSNSGTYGRLYNWYVVKTGKICPVGWHVPTGAEWTTLATSLGGWNSGDKLKETGTTHWFSPSAGTNESGFTALPGGFRIWSGTYSLIGYYGYWHSSTEGIGNYACMVINLMWDQSGIGYFQADKHEGVSLRCLKD